MSKKINEILGSSAVSSRVKNYFLKTFKKKKFDPRFNGTQRDPECMPTKKIPQQRHDPGVPTLH